MATQQLQQIISETLSPYAETRKTAEDHLKAAKSNPSHPLQVLEIVAKADGNDAAVRQAAAVHFKNVVKKGWDVQREEGNEGIVINDQDRITIKSHLVQLMCTTPPQIQVQLSEAISLIAAVDYPKAWDNLLPELVKQFQSPDQTVVNGVLKTANGIFKSFRFVQRSDDLYGIILYSLNIVQGPLLALFKSTGQKVDAVANNTAQLKPLMQSLRLMCRIFYSLNYQDLPEFFEDHMTDWMSEFAKYLTYQNPALVDTDEELEPSPIDSLQAAIIENLALYADKDEEPFMEYLPNFTRLVWNLLMTISAFPKHDSLATTSIRFLSSLVQKRMHHHLFQEEATLREIVLKIVIPNLLFRESDEERFEDDPREFIVTEVEGSDSESRRRCSQDLLRAMCRQFETQTTTICSEHVASMLLEFTNNPNGKWASKDAAIHLMMGIAIRRESSLGVSELNDAVNLMDFFQSQILPELQDPNHSNRPVVKATAIKFVSVFRQQFTREHLTQIMPMLIAQLGSPAVVVHTFAAYAIERILYTKETINGKKHPKFGAADLQPFLEPLFNGLFAIVDNVEHNENDYVMKCIMRSLATQGEGIIPVTQIVLTKLTAALGRVAKNPRNPQFNHFLFESIAVLVQSVCSVDRNATALFEPLLFEPFNIVLQMDIAEFTPYVFQILAQLLEYRPTGSGLGTAYQALFSPLLTPGLWDKRGNVPALSRLMQAYIRKAAPELVGQLNQILGVFQKLLSSRATEANAFDLLSSAILHFPQEEMETRIATIFQLVLTRLQAGKTPKYVRLCTHFFALFIGKYSANVFMDRMNAIQNGLSLNLLEHVWIPRVTTDPPVQRTEAKVQVVGLTKLLCEYPTLLNDGHGQAIWSKAVVATITILTSSSFKATEETGLDEEEIEIGYDAQFSQLKFARKAVEDPFPEVADPTLGFPQALHQVSSAHPGRILPLIQQGLNGADPKLSVGLESMLQAANVQLS
jgi:exportin-2 (importin alpha re-exporter)